MNILICGLPGSGKTTIAEKLNKELSYPRYNGDEVRKKFDDWDFSIKGRIRQAYRIKYMAKDNNPYKALIDFVCPLQKQHEIIDADFTIWMNTITESIYPDTNAMFEPPMLVDVEITDWDYDINDILKKIEEMYE